MMKARVSVAGVSVALAAKCSKWGCGQIIDNDYAPSIEQC
jgi:hypothetical protein